LCGDDTAWVIGAGREGGGYGIYRWSPGQSNWKKIPGSAMRVACGMTGNDAWVVNKSGNIYSFNGKSWKKMPGGAIDIGVGTNN